LAKQYTLAEFESAGVSVVGPVREDNQDSILVPSKSASNYPGSLHAVADGMGGYSYGELASSLALKNLLKVIHSKENHSLSPAKILTQALENVNLEVYKASQQLGNVRMGTTLTAAYVSGNLLYLLHIGDSRAYLIRNGRAACLTNDHTIVGDMVRSRLIRPEKIRTHDQRSVLTRAVGLKLFIQPDLSQTKLQIGDRIILCSDGVWSVIEDQEFAELSDRANDMHSLAQDLVDLAIERETDDNCSVIAIQIRGFRHQTFEEAPRKERGWLNFFRK
jgi:serine/threonine protein phosphatase PrpC